MITSNPSAGGPLLVGCPWLFIQYFPSYPPYLEAVSLVRNLRTRQAIMTRDQRTCVGEDERVQIFGGGTPPPPKKTHRRWRDNNIKMDHRETGYGGTVWILLAQNRD